MAPFRLRGKSEAAFPSLARCCTGVAVFALCVAFAATAKPGAAPKTPANPSNPTNLPLKTPTSAEWAATVAAACQEGTVNLYTNTIGLQSSLNAAFHDAYPCLTLNATVITSPAILISKLDSEQQGNLAGGDVFVLNVPDYCTQHALTKTLVPAVTMPSATVWAKNAPKALPDKGQGCFVEYSTLFVIAWNSNLVKKPMRSYKDFLRPDIKQIGVRDPALGPFQLAFYTWLNNHFGSDFMSQLGKKGVLINTAATPSVQSLASGETSVQLFNPVSVYLPVIKAGAPIGYYLPNPALTSPQYSGAVTWAKHPNAAKILMNWMMSPAGQQVALKANTGNLSSLGSKLVPASVALQKKTKTKAATKTFILPQQTDPAIIAAQTAKFTAELRGG